jgi:hypothetical protein
MFHPPPDVPVDEDHGVVASCPGSSLNCGLSVVERRAETAWGCLMFDHAYLHNIIIRIIIVIIIISIII